MRRGRILRAAVGVLGILALNSCATVNLVRWGADIPSIIPEASPESKGYVKPLATTLLFFPACALDVATVLPQVIFGVWPYGHRYLVPEQG